MVTVRQGVSVVNDNQERFLAKWCYAVDAIWLVKPGTILPVAC